MRALCVIPARIGSTRLPNKPLQVIAGEPLVAFVTRRIVDFGLFEHVIVATDNPGIAEAVSTLPVLVEMTANTHRCGTERVAEVARKRPDKYIVNVQSDEAFLPKKAITDVLELLADGAGLATAAMALTPEQRDDRHTSKVAVSASGRAMGFDRTIEDLKAGDIWVGRHLGLYGYEREALLRWAASPQTNDEITLGLEQLRPMSYGEPIAIARLHGTGPTGIDTFSDLDAAEQHMTQSMERVRV